MLVGQIKEIDSLVLSTRNSVEAPTIEKEEIQPYVDCVRLQDD